MENPERKTLDMADFAKLKARLARENVPKENRLIAYEVKSMAWIDTGQWELTPSICLGGMFGITDLFLSWLCFNLSIPITPSYWLWKFKKRYRQITCPKSRAIEILKKLMQ